MANEREWYQYPGAILAIGVATGLSVPARHGQR
jgi:hypothetical protein